LDMLAVEESRGSEECCLGTEMVADLPREAELPAPEFISYIEELGVGLRLSLIFSRLTE